MPRTVAAAGLVLTCVFSSMWVGACFASIDRSKIVDDAGADSAADALSGDAAVGCVGATLCDDFERTELLGPWSTLTIDRGGIAQIGSTQAHSGQKSLSIFLPAGTAAGAYFVSRPQPVASRSKLHYSMFVPAPPDRATMNVMSITFTYAGGRSVDIYLSLKGMTSLVAFLTTESMNGTPDAYDSLAGATLVTNRWVDVELDLQHTVTPSVATLTYDGKVVADALPLPRALPAGVPVLTAGINYGSTGSAVTVYFDDVRLDVTP